jgi:hypothetical protein
MADREQGEVLAVLEASAGRRLVGIAMLLGLGAMLLWIALTQTPSLPGRLFLVAAGAAMLALAEAMRRATASRVELTRDALRDGDGTVIATVTEIAHLERGLFAFKPSNGFLLRTRAPASRTWRPGLWWRMGRRIGIGGMTPGHQSKLMADILGGLLAERDGQGGRP